MGSTIPSDLRIPEGAIIGLIGEDRRLISNFLRERGTTGAYFAPSAAPQFASEARMVLIDHTLDGWDPLVCAHARHQLSALRRRGASILIATWDERLLREACDEVWWFRNGEAVLRAEPQEGLRAWNRHAAAQLQKERTGVTAPIEPSMRGGDGRGTVRQIELLNERAQPVLSWMSGERAEVSVGIEYSGEVAEPVVGMLIRTRIGLHVYGTNTELERLNLGPRKAGDRVRVSFVFRCDLCPGEYTVTVASHDPDGTWHDWLEDAVAFDVSDARYTAGVANLRSAVAWELY